MPCDLASFLDQIQRRRRQRRNVHGLADMAGALGSASVMVDKNATSSEIQESNAAQNGKCASTGNGIDRVHLP